MSIDTDKIKQTCKHRGLYWQDGMDDTQNVINALNNLHLRNEQNKVNSTSKMYKESAQKAWAALATYGRGMYEAMEKAKNVRDEWHKKKQVAESKAAHYKKVIDMCPVPGDGWGNVDVAVKQCEHYRAWYFKYLKPIIDKEPMT